MHRVETPTIAVAGSAERFPVRRIYCVGQNYADHAREMGGDPARTPPFFFGKPADAVVASGTALPFPSATANLHHEIELVVALGEGARVFGFAAGIDLTRRDLQAAAKEARQPWDMAKGFDRSAPLGALTRGQPPASGAIALAVNGETRQASDLARMIWSVPEILAALAGYVALAPGDLIFTGTPAGVGPLVRGDRVRGSVAGCEPVEISFT